jgi:Sulfotransferase family
MVVLLPNSQPVHPPPRPLVDPESRLILFWMHRCGSTTAQRWFFELAGWGNRMQGVGTGELAAAWYREHAAAYENLPAHYRDPSFLKVAVVRHPLSRAVSSFTVITDTKSGLQWRAVVASLAAPDDERRLTFLEFLDFLEGIDLATANYHWRLQSAQDWPGLPGTQLVRLESIQSGLDEVCRRLGKRPLPLKINSPQTKRATDIAKQEIVNFTRADFARTLGHDRRGIICFPTYTKFLTAETVDRLTKLYERDFAVLHYGHKIPPDRARWSLQSLKRRLTG